MITLRTNGTAKSWLEIRLMEKNPSLLKEAFEFVTKRKKWWFLPAVLAIIAAGFLIIFGQSSAIVSTLIYPLF